MNPYCSAQRRGRAQAQAHTLSIEKYVTLAAISPHGVARGRFVGSYQSGLPGCKSPPVFLFVTAATPAGTMGRFSTTECTYVPTYLRPTPGSRTGPGSGPTAAPARGATSLWDPAPGRQARKDPETCSSGVRMPEMRQTKQGTWS